jgi:hypothetical protein
MTMDSDRNERGRFQKGCKPGPGRPRKKERSLSTRLEDLQAAVNASDGMALLMMAQALESREDAYQAIGSTCLPETLRRVKSIAQRIDAAVDELLEAEESEDAGE